MSSAVIECEEKFRILLDAMSQGVIYQDADGTVVEANRAAENILGLSRDQIIGRMSLDPMWRCITEQGDPLAGEEHPAMVALRSGLQVTDSLMGVFHPDREQYRWITVSAVPQFRDGASSPYRVLVIFSDVTDQKKSETLIRENEERFRHYITNSPHAIFVCDETGHYVDVNPSACSLTGYGEEELLTLSIPDLLPPESLDSAGKSFRQVVESGRTFAEMAFKRKDGEIGYWSLAGVKLSPARYIAFVTNITARKLAEAERDGMERQLLHAQKLESLGVLAGGIAHDFNNILMAIIGNADLAMMRMNPESPAIENLHRIEKAAARAADLANQMLAYSGKGKFQVEQLDLNSLLKEMLHMLEVSISKKAVLRFNLHTPLPTVEADATQMRQIIMNLVINASEAIGDKSGVIAVTTGCMDCDQDYLKDVWLDENLSDGLYVYLEIADSGCGMDKNTMVKLFDPFFTTKFTGRGLGMAAVLGIVRGHKGAIKVYSESGKGSILKILLPASSRPAELFNGAPHIDGWKGSGTVLLVDDEETVRGIGAEMLKELGFTVVTANDGREAVNVFKSRDDISLVILDLTMPHLDGEQCFRELRLIKPAARVVMSSGYNELEVTQRFIGKGLAGFIQKPYKLSVLKEVLKCL
ncbi:MAG: PAS domain S-box protein [Desulfuromonadaceae bacterium]|nr:PAS domain S-box protein [Desulfuromonadaceae bacterium]MDD5104078.1 PAS domain S-box protein [Desulfuromonadaceae bacterium]